MYVLYSDSRTGNIKIFDSKVEIGVTRSKLRLIDINLEEVNEVEYFKNVTSTFEKCMSEGRSEKEIKKVLIKVCGMSESLADYYMDKQKVKTGQLSC